VIPTVAPYFLPPHLAAFSRQFSQTQLTVVEEITPVLLERLRAATADLAILALPIRGHEFDTFPILTERLFATVPKHHRLRRKSALSLKELRAEPFLLLGDGHCFRETALSACDRARLHPRIVFESGQFSSLLSMVGVGWAFPSCRKWPWTRSPVVPMSGWLSVSHAFAVALAPARKTRFSPVWAKTPESLFPRNGS
jgi:LysR family hydrogen peroxide-inducible transcriptional activator